MKEITVKLTDMQYQAVVEAAREFGIGMDDVFDVVLLPFVFAQAECDIPIAERKYNEYLMFMRDCLSVKQTKREKKSS
jgi:hypothetical protein